MILFLVYAVILAFFWMKTLLSTIHSDNDAKVSAFLALKYQKIRRYKQYGMLYIIELFYLISISMVSARFIPPNSTQTKPGLTHAWELMIAFPLWLQLLFFIALIGLLTMLILPAVNAYQHQKQQKQIRMIQ
ncbi:hypothetical protein [Facilibium subflavum]|uniref:hypothetical protein n=1 Tax=Facilibium subflavum TaxID=2219058 RepID=UPI000E64801C|nr:hypothetical protein [Facilibium subflavum]